MRMSQLPLLGLLLLPVGCMTVPPGDNPMTVRASSGTVENPVLISPGTPTPSAYAAVFERTLDVVEDHFEIAYSNRYDGRIICAPKIAPGYFRFWEYGTPDGYERLLATMQTMRYRCFIQIKSAEQGGYLVQVTVYKELKDEGRPTVAPSGSIFRDAATVDRQFEVVDPEVVAETGWIPKGREHSIEDEILREIRRCGFE